MLIIEESFPNRQDFVRCRNRYVDNAVSVPTLALLALFVS